MIGPFMKTLLIFIGIVASAIIGHSQPLDELHGINASLDTSVRADIGMLDDAALALEEIEPKDKTRTEVLGARVVLYIAAKKWDMAAAVASHLVKVEPENEAWWINLAYSVRRSEGVEKAEAVLLRAQVIHPKVAMIAFSLACYASVTGRMEEAKARLQHAVELDRNVRRLAVDDDDLRPLWDLIGDWSAWPPCSHRLRSPRPLCPGDQVITAIL